MEDHAGILEIQISSSMAEACGSSPQETETFISAGNSGALVVGSTLIVKRIPKIKRPAFAPIMPKKRRLFHADRRRGERESKPEMLSNSV